jgi:hypothetical protein
MNNRSSFQFRWLSPLGVSVTLFLLSGAALSLALGIQWTIILHTSFSKKALLTSERTDTVVFGAPPAVLYENDPILFTVSRAEEDWRDGMAFGLGITQVALAWFGLRRNQRWALWTLTASGLSMIPYAVLFIEPVLRAHAPWSVLDLPPMLTIQVSVVPIAVILGWIGQSSRFSKDQGIAK